jgi:hypothetical protein
MGMSLLLAVIFGTAIVLGSAVIGLFAGSIWLGNRVGELWLQLATRFCSEPRA